MNVTLEGKRDAAGIIKLEPLGWGINLNYPGAPSVILRGLIGEERRCHAAGLEAGAREKLPASRSRKRPGSGFPPGPQEGCSPGEASF